MQRRRRFLRVCAANAAVELRAMTLARATDRIESARLVLRRIAPGDLLFFTRIHAVADVVRYIGHGRPRSCRGNAGVAAIDAGELRGVGAWTARSAAQRRRCAARPLRLERPGRRGRSALERHSSRVVRPRAGARRTRCDSRAGVGLHLRCGTFWGHGYATEAAQCVFAYARDVLGLRRVISVIDCNNVRSQRVAERCSLRRDGQIDDLGRTLDVYVWPT